MSRRRFLKFFAGSGALITAASISGCRIWPDEGFKNPCLTGGLPDSLAKHELLEQAWEGINPKLYRDIHTHLIGTGDSDSGIWINPELRSIWHPIQNIQFSFYLNASYSENQKHVDQGYVNRLYSLMNDFPEGAKAILLAFEHHYDLDGKIDLQNSNKDLSEICINALWVNVKASAALSHTDVLLSTHMSMMLLDMLAAEYP